MAGTKSDLTNKKFSGGPGLRTFSIPDETEQFPYQEGDPLSQQELESIDPKVVNAMNAHLAAKGLPPIGYSEPVQQGPQSPKQYARPAPHNQFENVNDLEQQISAARRAKANPGKERLSDNAKRRIEMLCGMYRGTREVLVGDQVFTLQTLPSNEIRDSMLAASDFAGTLALPFETRKQFLARSVTHISGTEITMFLGDPSLEARLEFFELLPEVLIERLFKEYDELDRETKIKFGVQSAEQAQEVAADLKK
jgi:hypothetical protein